MMAFKFLQKCTNECERSKRAYIYYFIPPPHPGENKNGKIWMCVKGLKRV